VFLGKHLDVRRHFRVEFLVEASGPGERVEPGEQDNESRQHGVTGRRAAASAS